MYRRIFVPIDGSATAQKGFEEAVKLAKTSGAVIKVVHVINQFVDSSFGPAIYNDSMVADLRATGARILEEAATYAGRQGVPVETGLVEATTVRVASIIIDEVNRWDADLISMGTHGRRGLSRLALGSDAELVLRSTPVPILLVRDPMQGQ